LARKWTASSTSHS